MISLANSCPAKVSKYNNLYYNNFVYLTLVNDTDKDAEEKSSSDEESEKVPVVEVDESGHPILPTCGKNMNLKLRQVVVRQIFTKAYSKFGFSCYL